MGAVAVVVVDQIWLIRTFDVLNDYSRSLFTKGPSQYMMSRPLDDFVTTGDKS